MRILIRGKCFLAIVLSVMACVSAYAQDKYSKEKSEITKVKRAPELYVFAEATCKTKEEAAALAEDIFYQNVNEYVAEQRKLRKLPDIVLRAPKALVNEVSMPRGTNMYRCFFYVKKKDIIGSENTVLIANPHSESGADQSQAVDLAATTETVSKPEPEPEPAPVFPEAAVALAGIANINELNSAIKEMKQEGTIVEYDKYKNIADKAGWYFVLYDASGKVNALLSDGEERYNVSTGKKDELANYPKNAALGIKFKK